MPNFRACSQIETAGIATQGCKLDGGGFKIGFASGCERRDGRDDFY
jgi:hypothetical protein